MVKGVLVDISGVLHVGGTALPGAAGAMAELRGRGLPVRFLTNTTRKPKRAVIAQLRGLGVEADDVEVFTPAGAACDWLRENGYAPHLLIYPDLAEDFADCATDGPKAVVLGDAGPYFAFDVLNTAFRLLVDGAPFLALAANRMFMDEDGKLSMDAGAFVQALEYSSGVKAHLLGKPAPAFFAAAAASMGCGMTDVAMIGDDAEADVAGALDAGAAQGILVRTGKYRAGDEDAVTPAPTAVAENIAAAVDEILDR